MMDAPITSAIARTSGYGIRLAAYALDPLQASSFLGDHLAMRLWYTVPVEERQKKVTFIEDSDGAVTFRRKSAALIASEKLARFLRKGRTIGSRDFTKPARFIE